MLHTQGERIVLTADGLPDLALIALPTNSRKRQAGQLKHAITIQDPHWDKADREMFGFAPYYW